MKDVSESHPRPQPSPLFDELLSAYHDGELPPQEREAVERRLASSPEARQKLQEFRRLSGFLHELPQAKLPQEFSRQVLREAEREMLIPRLRGTAPVVRRRPWLFATVGLAASVAAIGGVMLLVRPQDSAHKVTQEGAADHTVAVLENGFHRHKAIGGPQGDPASTVAMPAVATHVESRNSASAVSDSPSALHADNSTRRIAEPTIVAGKEAVSDVRSKDALVSGERKMALKSSVDSHRAGMVSSDAKLQAMDQKRKTNADWNDDDSGKLQKARLKDLAAGEIVDALRVTGSRAAVVRLVVVDQAAVMKVVQVVLDQNNVSPGGAGGFATGGGGRPQPEVGAESQIDGLQCVLVETTNDQLLEVVKGLLKQDPVIRSLQVEEPIEIAELTETAQPSRAQVAEPKMDEDIASKKVGEKPLNPASGMASRTMARTQAARHATGPTSSTPSAPAPALTRSENKQTEEQLAESKRPREAGVPKMVEKPALSSNSVKSTPLFAEKSEGNGAPARVTRGKARMVQLPQVLNRQLMAGKNTRNRRVPSPPLEDELLASGKARVPASNAPTGPAGNAPAADKDDSNSRLAKLPATAMPAGSLPVHILFVLEPQSVSIPIDAPAKAKVPGKSGGARGNKSRFSRQG